MTGGSGKIIEDYLLGVGCDNGLGTVFKDQTGDLPESPPPFQLREQGRKSIIGLLYNPEVYLRRGERLPG